MTVSEYEECFRLPAPSLHEIFTATRGRNQGRRRLQRIWLVAAAIGVLTITSRVASHHPVHDWTTSLSRTTAVQGQSSPTVVSIGTSAMAKEDFRECHQRVAAGPRSAAISDFSLI